MYAGDLVPGGEFVEYQALKVRRRGGRYVREEVVRAGEVVDGTDLGLGEQVLDERVHERAAVWADLDEEERLQRAAELRSVDGGVLTGDHAGGAEAVHPIEASRRCDADSGRELLVRYPRVVLQES